MHRRHEPNNIPIEVLRSFVTILETGSFTKAAGLLKLTQPAISAHIKRLQSLVGEELFQKNSVGVALSEKGDLVSRYAQRILTLNDQILLAGRCDRKFRIGIPSIATGPYLRALNDALQRNSVSSVQVVSDKSEFLLKRLAMGHFDIVLAFSAEPADIPPLHEWAEPLAWVSDPNFILSPGAPLPLLSWPNSECDRVAIRMCEMARVLYTTEFVADELAAHLEALQLKLGYLCMIRRFAPKGLKLAQEYFLPKLPQMHAGIYTNLDQPDRQIENIVRCMVDVFDVASTHAPSSNLAKEQRRREARVS